MTFIQMNNNGELQLGDHIAKVWNRIQLACNSDNRVDAVGLMTA